MFGWLTLHLIWTLWKFRRQPNIHTANWIIMHKQCNVDDQGDLNMTTLSCCCCFMLNISHIRPFNDAVSIYIYGRIKRGYRSKHCKWGILNNPLSVWWMSVGKSTKSYQEWVIGCFINVINMPKKMMNKCIVVMLSIRANQPKFRCK